ncbi:ABC transporter substrate-binding protein [Streptomyces sp. NPDC047002]|uniref:ABC transporter substrate-binding protein n=1 Tax=Streptomyces sp. NPDC047002 TaxID=3155475 RepID=UPI0034551021
MRPSSRRPSGTAAAGRRRLRGPAALGAATLALSLTAACGGSGASDAGASDGVATVRLGIYPGNLISAQIAQQQGYFKKHRLNVTFRTLSAGPAIVAATENGSVDVGYGDTLAVAAAAANGFGKVKVIQPGNIQTTEPSSDEDLLAGPASGVKSVADLKGKTIGVIPYPEINVAARLLLKNHGVDPDSATFITITDGTQAALLKTGGADAVEGRNIGEDKKLAGESGAEDLGSPLDAIPPHTITTSYFGNTEWLKKNPGAAARLVAALREAAHYYNTAPDSRLGALGAQYGGVDYPALAKKYPDILQQAHWGSWPAEPAGPADIAATQKWIATAVSFGQLKKTVRVEPLLYRTATESRLR